MVSLASNAQRKRPMKYIEALKQIEVLEDTMAETTELMTVGNICRRVYIIRGLHVKKMPYAFTEQGIYMLAPMSINCQNPTQLFDN